MQLLLLNCYCSEDGVNYHIHAVIWQVLTPSPDHMLRPLPRCASFYVYIRDNYNGRPLAKFR